MHITILYTTTALLLLTSLINHHVDSFAIQNSAIRTKTEIPDVLFQEEQGQQDRQNESFSNRIFVAGISQTCTEEELRDEFSQFGPIQDITIIGQDDGEKQASSDGSRNSSRKRRRRRSVSPYCFVSFQDATSAQQALFTAKSNNKESSPSNAIYKEVQYAKPLDPRRRSEKSRLKEREERSAIEELSQDANLIAQVHSTHLDRFIEYLNRLTIQNKKRQPSSSPRSNLQPPEGFSVVGSTRVYARNMNLLFLRTEGDPILLSRMLCMDPVLARALNKVYIVQSGILLKGDLSTKERCDEFSKQLFDNKSLAISATTGTRAIKEDISMDEKQRMKRVLRIQVFPPKNQFQFLQSFDTVLNEDEELAEKVTIAPNGFTHMLSIVEVYQYNGRGQGNDNDKLYMAGISPASFELDVVDTNNKYITKDEDNSRSGVNRAFYKLKEAFEMYSADYDGFDHDMSGSIALDCGSAPGGWTKYLIDHLDCQRVFSIDPGALSPSVLELEETSHMQMKIQDALPILLNEDGAKGEIKIWVSDMCLHQMESQVDLLLLAKRKGLLAPKTFFVLTLKCVVGRSKISFDTQVQEVVESKLCTNENNVDQVTTYHLFSNRSGERTVMGYIS